MLTESHFDISLPAYQIKAFKIILMDVWCVFNDLKSGPKMKIEYILQSPSLPIKQNQSVQ